MAVPAELVFPSSNWIRVSQAGRFHGFEFASRDWKVLLGPHVPEGAAWLRAFGFNGPTGTSVSRGLEVGYTVAGDRAAALSASRALQRRVEADKELLAYDYWANLAPDPIFGAAKRRVGGGGIAGLRLRGESHALWVPPGHCYLQQPGESADLIDLRNVRRFQFDPPLELTVHRRRRGLAWPGVLPGLIDYLSESTAEALEIYNHHQ